MRKLIRFGLVWLALFVGSSGASAALINVEADAKFSGFSDFSLTFDDGPAGDGKFELSELVSFSGMGQSGVGFFPTITRVPDIDWTVVSGSCGAPDSEWCFGNGSITVVGRGYWTYTLTEVSSGVPEPGTLALIVGALAAAAVARRRRAV